MDDPRNTDNAWMETVAVNFHDDTGEVFSEFKLQVSCVETIPRPLKEKILSVVFD